MNLELKRSAGISLLFDGKDISSNDLKFHKRINFLISDISSQLINDDLSYPEYFYSKYTAGDINSIFMNKFVKLNFYTIAPGVAGIEFIKTKASVLYDHDRLVEVLHGGGMCILQKDDNDMPTDIILIRAKSTDKFIIPAGYHSVFINTKSSFLILSEVHSTKGKIHYDLEDMRGLAYYVISKNSRPEIVRNPTYKTAPKVRKVDWNALAYKLSISPKTPIIKQILRKYDKFNWLFQENSNLTV